MSKDTFKLAARPKSAKQLQPKMPWNTWLGLGFGIFALVGMQYLAGFIAGSIIYAIYGTGSHSDMLFKSAAFQFYFVLLAEVLTVGAIVLFMRHYKALPAIIGFVKPRLRDLGLALLALPVYYLLFISVAAIAQGLFPSLNVSQKQELGFDSVIGLKDQIFTFFSLVVLAPLAEEYLFRGFIYSTLRGSIGVIWAALLTSALFGAAHLLEGGSGGPLYIGAIQTFCLSIVLVYVRQKSKSLWPGIWLHAANNGVAFVVLFVLHSQ